jgi:hypothetical protein
VLLYVACFMCGLFLGTFSSSGCVSDDGVISERCTGKDIKEMIAALFEVQ